MPSARNDNAPRTRRTIPSMLPPVDGRGAVTFLAAPFVLVALLGLVGCQRAQSGDTAKTADDRPGADVATALAKTVSGSTRVAPECCEQPGDEPTSTVTPVAAALKVETQPQRLPSGFQMPRAVLVDQNGKSVNLYNDLVKGRVVVMNFIFTTCRGICPPLGASFGALQKQLGDGSGRDVSLISISVDPVTDTPQRLKAWADQFGAKQGWTLLTGRKAEVDSVLKSLGVFAANKNEHSPYLLIGSEAAGHWTRVHGLTSTERVVEITRQLILEGREAGGSGDGPKPPGTTADGLPSAARKVFHRRSACEPGR